MFDEEAGMMLLVGWNCLTDDITAQTDLHRTLDLEQLLPEVFRSPKGRMDTSPVALTRQYLAIEWLARLTQSTHQFYQGWWQGLRMFPRGLELQRDEWRTLSLFCFGVP